MDSILINRIEIYKKKGIKNFDSDVANKIYEFLFKNWHTKIEVSSYINPEAHDYKRKQKRIKPTGGFYVKDYKVSALGYIRDYINAFYELGWLETDRKMDKEFVRKSKGVKFIANLEPYFEYIKIKKGVSLSKELKNYLINEMQGLRETVQCSNNLNFLESLDKFVKEVIVYSSMKLYLNKLTSSFFNKKSLDDVRLRLSLALVLYDKFTLKLLQEYLINKIYATEEMLKPEEKSMLENFIFKIEKMINPTRLPSFYENSKYPLSYIEKLSFKEREIAERYNKKIQKLQEKRIKEKSK